MKVVIQSNRFQGAPDGVFLEIPVNPGSTFGEVKGMIAAQLQNEFKLENYRYRLSFKGEPIPDSAALEEVGVEDQDMIRLDVSDQQQQRQAQQHYGHAQQGPSQGQAQAQQGGGYPMGEQGFPGGLAGFLSQLLQGGPPMQQRQIQQQAQRVGGGERDMEAILEARQIAMEENPEAFADVVMLYVDAVVNGVHLKAFVDTGAQKTVMSKECARKCDVLRLADPAFAGVAMGVGAARILGRVLYCPMKIGDSYYKSSFIVLEQSQNIDLLIGLDMLKRYHCSVDLENNVLRFNDTGKEVPFLSEKDVPEHAKLHNR